MGLFDTEGEFLTQHRDKLAAEYVHNRDRRTTENPFRMVGGAFKAYNAKNSKEAQEIRDTEAIMEQIDIRNPMEVNVALKELITFNPKGAAELMALHRQLREEPAEPVKRDILKGADGFNYYTDTQERVLPNVQKEPGDGAKPSNAAKMTAELIKGDEDLGIPGMTPSLARKIGYNMIKPVTDPTTGDTVLYDESNPGGEPIVLAGGDKIALKFQQNLKEFGDRVEKSGISQQEFNIQEVEKIMFTTNKEGERVAIEDVPGFGLTGMAPEATLTQKGKNLRQSLATMMNMTLKDRSGAAVTNPEFNRFKKEFSAGMFQTDLALINAVKRVRRIFDRHKQSIAAGFDDGVVNKYSTSSGIGFRPVASSKESGGMTRSEDGVWRPGG